VNAGHRAGALLVRTMSGQWLSGRVGAPLESAGGPRVL